MLAAGLVAVAAWMDSNATALTRPAQLLATQTILGCGLALFVGASVIAGFGRVLAEGIDKMVSFIAAYAFAQYFGALLVRRGSERFWPIGRSSTTPRLRNTCRWPIHKSYSDSRSSADRSRES